ncbi:retrovirus-related pol polyprotein from transposon TNT 1-94 [Tanacetum coccineum]
MYVHDYLKRYSKEFVPKVVFGDNSSGDTKGYGSVNCNEITFTRVAYVNGLKHNLISISQLCDANFKLMRKGTITEQHSKPRGPFSINRSLHLLHMDLFGPVKPQTISHNKYTLVIVDEYSRYTWVFCLKKKSDVADCIMSFIRKMENLNEVRVKELRSDNGTEFRNHTLEEFCDKKGISHNFSSPCTPEQNGVAKRRNWTLIEAARTMLNMAKAFRVFNIKRQKMEETFHVTFSEDDEAISQTSTKGDAVNFNEVSLFPDDEFLEPRCKETQSFANTEYFPYDSIPLDKSPEFTNEDDVPTTNEADHPKSADEIESVDV